LHHRVAHVDYYPAGLGFHAPPGLLLGGVCFRPGGKDLESADYVEVNIDAADVCVVEEGGSAVIGSLGFNLGGALGFILRFGGCGCMRGCWGGGEVEC